MNTKSANTYGLSAIAALCLLLSTSAVAAPGAQVKLVGQNDENVDRAAIQAAIDSAPGENLTVKLRGTFQLDGLDIIIDRSNLVIKGDRGGATLQGKLDLDGLPIDDIENFPNRGFLIESTSALMNIEIKDVAFTGFRSPILARGQLNEISGVSIKNNSVENSLFGFVATGEVSDVMIASNDVVGVTNTGINVFSTGAGQVSDIRIVDNYIADAVLDAIFIGEVSGAIIANNFLSTSNEDAFPAPFVADGMNADILFEGNTIQGGFTGALLLGDADGFTMTRNCIRDGGTQGIPFFSGGGIQVGIFGLNGTGFEITDNSYEGNVGGAVPAPRDIWLTVDSANSAMTERVGTVVLDEGSSNSVALIADDGANHCDD